MKLTHVCKTFLPKTESFIFRSLDLDGISSSVVCTRRQNADLYPVRSITQVAESYWWCGAQDWMLKNFGVHPLWMAQSSVQAAISKHARESDIAVFHHGWVSMYMRKVRHHRATTWFHGADLSKWLQVRGYTRHLNALCMNRYSVVPSPLHAERLRAVAPQAKPIFVNCYGVELPAISVLDRWTVPRGERKSLRLLQVGAFREKKAQQVTVEAAVRLINSGISISVDFVGDGDRLNEVKAQVRKHAAIECFRFHGHQPKEHVQHLLRNADVFVHPSVTARSGDQEGVPNAILEAMAYGLPIAATVHAGIPHAVRNGLDGYLVPEYNSDALADAILKLSRWGYQDALRSFRRIESEFSQHAWSERTLAIARNIKGDV